MFNKDNSDIYSDFDKINKPKYSSYIHDFYKYFIIKMFSGPGLFFLS